MPDIESVLIHQARRENGRKNAPEGKKHTVRNVILRFFLCIFTALALCVAGLLSVVLILEFGPSEKARDLFVVSMMETSAAKFLATGFLGQEKVDEILAANSIQETDGISDSDMVIINEPSDEPETNVGKTIPGSDNQPVDPDGDGIDIVEFSGSTYKGWMMLVYDPTRVFVGVCGEFGVDKPGKIITDIYDSYDNVVACVNGGGWDDRPGHGTGGEPWGIVMSEGEPLWGFPNSTSWGCCAITEEGKLVVGTMSIDYAQSIGVRDACKYGPALIVNGEAMESLGTGSGLNPRTAIGQRADGAMLILVIDGRQSNSLGASLTDLQEVFGRFGAVNAYNLDGGSSTSMIFKGEIVNCNASLVGLRRMCTTIMVRGTEADNA